MPSKIYQRHLKAELTQAVIDVCRSKLPFNTRFSVEGLLGVTLEDGEVFLINLQQMASAAGDMSMGSPTAGCSQDVEYLDHETGRIKSTKHGERDSGEIASRQFASGIYQHLGHQKSDAMYSEDLAAELNLSLDSDRHVGGISAMTPNREQRRVARSKRSTDDENRMPDYPGRGSKSGRRGAGQKDRNHEAFWEEFEAVFLACKQSAEHPNWTVPQIMWHVQSVHKLGENITVSRFQHYLSRFVFNMLDCRLYLRNAVTGQAERVCVSEEELAHLIRETHRSNHASSKNIYEILRAKYYPCNIKKFHDIYINQVIPDCDSCSLKPRMETSPRPRKRSLSQSQPQAPPEQNLMPQHSQGMVSQPSQSSMASSSSPLLMVTPSPHQLQPAHSSSVSSLASSQPQQMAHSHHTAQSLAQNPHAAIFM